MQTEMGSNTKEMAIKATIAATFLVNVAGIIYCLARSRKVITINTAKAM
jgi:hypothetical protein